MVPRWSPHQTFLKACHQILSSGKHLHSHHRQHHNPRGRYLHLLCLQWTRTGVHLCRGQVQTEGLDPSAPPVHGVHGNADFQVERDWWSQWAIFQACLQKGSSLISDDNLRFYTLFFKLKLFSVISQIPKSELSSTAINGLEVPLNML